MKMFKIENVIFVMVVCIITIAMYFEYTIKESMYENEKTNDLQIQYDSKLLINDKIVDALFDELLFDIEMKQLLFEASNGISKDKNRKKLYNLFRLKYKNFKKRGIDQLHFHLANGESFLRFHKPKSYGDSLLFRNNIKTIIRTKKKTMGFEIGKYFEGYRFMYPLFYDGKYIGSVEAGVNTYHVLTEMKKLLNMTYNLVINTEELHRNSISNKINSHYKMFCDSEDYLISKVIEGTQGKTKEALLSNKNTIINQMKHNVPFTTYAYQNNDIKLFVFIPIIDVNNRQVGYFFSEKNDNTIQKIIGMQFIKFIIALVLLSLLFYFYKQNKRKSKMIEQLTNAIDKTTLVSKTNLKGQITYVNDAFAEISGYTKKELYGKAHNIVRDPNMSKDTFDAMWKQIKLQKTWQGKITNRKKDGSKYIVHATIIPIVDPYGVTIEYISIRHDITDLEKYKNILEKQIEDKTKTLEENIHYSEQYESAIDNSTAILKTDTNNDIVYVNKKFCLVSGYSADELIGTNCKELRHENHIKMNDCENIIKKLQEKETVSLVFTNYTKEKELFFLDTVIHPITDTEDTVVEHLHIMHDISEIINLHQELEDTQKEIIYKMGEIGETRSKETGHHVKRVAEYSKLLGLLYGLNEKDAEILKLASPMHDIGKVGIPDHVLKKPGKLNNVEWDVMKTHAELGYEMLKNSV